METLATPVAAPAAVPSPVPTAPIDTLVLTGLGVSVLGTLAGCGGGGGGDAAPAAVVPPANTITGFSVRAVDGSALAVTGVAGANLAAAGDPGAGGVPRTLNVTVVVAVPGARAATPVTLLTIVLNPLPAEVIAVFPTQAATTRATLAQIGFPPTWDELASHLFQTPAQILARALARMSATPAEPYPAWIDARIKSWTEYIALSKAEQDAYSARSYPQRQEFKAWWFRQMVRSPDALTERLLLFWHNLFTTSASGVDAPELIARQHRLYRQQLHGNLKTFLHAMSRDPAMCEYLDSARNYKAAPNENFARELMELFTLGERNQYGGYAEDDVPALAKFFTGYLLESHEEFTFTQTQHETAAKTLFGQVRPTAPADGYAKDGDWAIDRILEKADGGGHSYAARYLVTRLWREFLGEPTGVADTARIQVIADKLSGSFAWDLPELYLEFFSSPAFTDASRRGHRVRSPVELFAGFYRPLEQYPDSWTDQLWTFYVLDQDLLDPPNVFGWPGGTSWINLKTVIDRRQVLSWLQWTARLPKLPARLDSDAVLRLLLLAIAPLDPPLTSGDWESHYINTRIGHLLTDPVYNVG